MLYPRFIRALEENSSIPRGAHILVALSGGPDSTALLLLFRRYVSLRRPDIELYAGHVNHSLRGAASDSDEAHCRRQCEQLGIEFLSEQVDVQALADQQQMSLETAGRQARLEAYRRWMEHHELWAVATGHHSDDQAETVLGNILRGTGLSGLAAMPSETELWGVRVIRPMLGMARAELLSFVAAEGVQTCDDESNTDTTFRRNRLRHDLLPMLEQFNPAIKRALLGLAEDASGFLELRKSLVEPLLSHVEWRAGIAHIPRPALRSSGHVLAHAVLDRIWRQVSGHESGLDRSHHHAWQGLVDGAEGNTHDLPDGWLLQRAADSLWLLKNPENDEPRAIPIESDGMTDVPWLGAHLSCTAVDGTALPLRWLPRACLRPAQPGDRLPIEEGHADIQEVLRAHGVPSALRNRYPILEQDGIPLWIPGCRRAYADEESIEEGSAWLGFEFDDPVTPAGFVLRCVMGS